MEKSRELIKLIIKSGMVGEPNEGALSDSLIEKVMVHKFNEGVDAAQVIAAIKIACEVCDFLSKNVCPLVNGM